MTMVLARVERPNRTDVMSVPCGRRLAIGERAVLYRDAIYCMDCFAMLPALGPRPFEFTLKHGAICGGGVPLG